MAAAQKKPAGTAKTTAPRTSTAGKENTVSRSRQGTEDKESIVIKASRSKVIANNYGSKDK